MSGLKSSLFISPFDNLSIATASATLQTLCPDVIKDIQVFVIPNDFANSLLHPLGLLEKYSFNVIVISFVKFIVTSNQIKCNIYCNTK